MAKLSSQTFVSALVGAGSALLVVLAFDGDREPVKAAAVAEGPEASTAYRNPKTGSVERDVVVRYDDDRVTRLEEQLGALKRAGDETEPDEPPKDGIPPTPEEERRLLEAYYDDLEQKFVGDGFDADWSPDATHYLQDGLLALGELGGFALDAVECRSTYCKAEVSWGDYASAVDAENLPEQPIPGLNCATSMWLPEPEHVDEPYSSEVYFDCSELRSGLVQPAPLFDQEGEQQ